MPTSSLSKQQSPIRPYVQNYALRLSPPDRFTSSRDRWPFVHHASVLQHVGPLPTRAGMAVFEMLPEVVCPKELLAGIAFAELVHVL